MKRLLFFNLAMAAFIAACGIPAVETETPQPTETESPSEPSTPISTSTIPPEAIIEPGLYEIGMGEGQLAPGVYFASGPECAWERRSGTSGAMSEVLASAGPLPRFYVEILDTDTAFRLKWCPMAPLDQVPAPAEMVLPIWPGVYIVGRDIEPGLYQGYGENCYWERLSGLTGSYELVIDNDRPDGQFYANIQESDMAFYLRACSMMPLSQIPEPTEFLTHLEPGMYLVGRDIEAGLYQGEGSCYWQRRSNFAGGREGLIDSEATEGVFQVQIEATDLLFRLSGCAVDRVE